MMFSKSLTTMGKVVVEKNQDPDVPVLKLDDIVKNTDLLDASLTSFNKGDFEAAILDAFGVLDQKMSKTAQLSADDLGMAFEIKNTAFGPISGKPIIPPSTRKAEQQGVQSLTGQAVAFFTNPASVRLINFGDRLEVIKIIAFAELLLEILSKTQIKPNP